METRRYKIIVELTENPELQHAIGNLCSEFKLSRFTHNRLAEVIFEGACMEEIRSGRADIEPLK